MLTADTVTYVRDDAWVVGVEFEDQSYAFPYEAPDLDAGGDPDRSRQAADSALVAVRQRRAGVSHRSRDQVARVLDIVSMPASSLLLCNTRIGQFINGITGQTPQGKTPDDFKEEIPVTKTTWKKWRTTHADSKVMVATGKLAHNPPAAPVLPVYPLPREFKTEGDPNRRIAVIPTTQPIAIATEKITTKPNNVMAGKLPVLIFRESATGEIRAFDRPSTRTLMPQIFP